MHTLCIKAIVNLGIMPSQYFKLCKKIIQFFRASVSQIKANVKDFLSLFPNFAYFNCRFWGFLSEYSSDSDNLSSIIHWF